MLSAYVASIWIVYFVTMLGIRFSISSTAELFFKLTRRFKIFIAGVVLIHFIAYTFYVGDFGNFGAAVLGGFRLPSSVLSAFYILGWLLAAGGLVFSAVAYYQLRTFNSADSIFYQGVFKKVRWPFQTGLLLLWFGIALIYNNAFGIVLGIILLVPILYFQVKLEEKDIFLAAEGKGLGKEYELYRAKTNLFLPFKLFSFFQFKKENQG